MIRSARGREPASVGPRNFVDSECADNFFDKVDITLQIPPITRNFPYSILVRAFALLQPKPRENFIDCFGFDRDSNDSVAFVVAQRNVRRIWLNVAGGSLFLFSRFILPFPAHIKFAL